MSSLRNYIFDYDPPDDASAPSDYPYLIVLRHFLSVIRCSWPHGPTDLNLRRRVWIWVHKLILSLICYLPMSGGFLYVVLHIKSMTFFELGHAYITILMSVVAISRMWTLCFSEEYRAVTQSFISKIHLFFYKDRSEFSMRTHKQVHRISHFFTLYLTGEMLVGLFLFNNVPFYNNYSAGKYKSGGLKLNATYEHSLYLSYPFNVSTNLNGYIIAYILNWIISTLCSCWFCVLDCFLSIMVFQIWGHFKILLYNLDNFPKPAAKINFMLENSNVTLTNEIYSPEEQKQVSVQLKECIEYHREIVKFTDKMSDVFGPMLFVYYAFHQASGCILLLECSQMTAAALSRYLPLTIILFQQLMQLSIIFELIGSISSRLRDSVYGLPWESMDTKNRKIVAFFLMNVQEPVHVKALGLANVGVTSMTTILKTSMSYFTFLNSM